MKKLKYLILTLISFGVNIPLWAQSDTGSFMSQMQKLDSGELTLVVITGILLFVIVILLVLMIYLMSFMITVFKNENAELAAQPSWWDEFKVKHLTGKLKPVGSKEEKDMMLDHNYDGIVELDNHMPPWLANVFYVTIAFGVIYFTYYSVLGLGKTQLEEYQEELRIAEIEAEKFRALAVSSIDESSVIFDESASALSAGQRIFSANCAACHAQDGGGGVGPNLTDEYWLHGGSIQDIFRVTKYGIPEKGMIPWQDQLSPEEMQQVSSFIKSLQGTTPANPKEPQGEKYIPEEADEEEAEESEENVSEA